MNNTILYTEELIALSCGTRDCGIPFAIPRWLYRQANDNHRVYFYCPNGHHIGYSGKTDTEKARERAAEAEREAQRLRDRLVQASKDTQATQRRLSATKGALTKARKRADQGVCQHCRRSFVNVARHVQGQHPDVLV